MVAKSESCAEILHEIHFVAQIKTSLDTNGQ